METATIETKKKSKIAPIIGISVVLVAIFFIGKTVIHGMNYEDTDNAQLETNILPIAPRVSGFVEKIYAEDNMTVKTGDTLLVLEHNDLALRVKQAEVNLANAMAQYGVIGSNSATAKVNTKAVGANIATAKANIEAANVRLWKATQEYGRYDKLLQQQSITQQQFDAIKAEKESAEKQVAIANSQLNAAIEQSAASTSQAGSVSAQLKPAELVIDQRKQELEMAKLNLSYAVVKAPIDGYISKKSVQLGQLINTGQTLLYLVDNKNVWVVANYKETQLNKIKVGGNAAIEIDAFKKIKLQGKVQSIQHATGAKFSLLPADNSSGNFVKVVQRVPVKILLENKDNSNTDLRPGMNCVVSIKAS